MSRSKTTKGDGMDDFEKGVEAMRGILTENEPGLSIGCQFASLIAAVGVLGSGMREMACPAEGGGISVGAEVARDASMEIAARAYLLAEAASERGNDPF